MKPKPLNVKRTLWLLRYIAASPEQRHGGFHPQVIQGAVSALYHLRKRGIR